MSAPLDLDPADEADLVALADSFLSPCRGARSSKHVLQPTHGGGLLAVSDARWRSWRPAPCPSAALLQRLGASRAGGPCGRVQSTRRRAPAAGRAAAAPVARQLGEQPGLPCGADSAGAVVQLAGRAGGRRTRGRRSRTRRSGAPGPQRVVVRRPPHRPPCASGSPARRRDSACSISSACRQPFMPRPSMCGASERPSRRSSAATPAQSSKVGARSTCRRGPSSKRRAHAGADDDQRHADVVVERRALSGRQAVLSQVVAVVGAEHHVGLVGDPLRRERRCGGGRSARRAPVRSAPGARGAVLQPGQRAPVRAGRWPEPLRAPPGSIERCPRAMAARGRTCAVAGRRCVRPSAHEAGDFRKGPWQADRRINRTPRRASTSVMQSAPGVRSTDAARRTSCSRSRRSPTPLTNHPSQPGSTRSRRRVAVDVLAHHGRAVARPRRAIPRCASAPLPAERPVAALGRRVREDLGLVRGTVR